MGGRIPDREENLARPRSRKGRGQQATAKGELRPVTWPRPDPDWHKIARELYLSCKRSGQADFYQQSDVALLFSLCDDLSYIKQQGSRRSSEMLKGVYSALGSLLVTEGDRRRVRIELTEGKDDGAAPASVTAIASYRQDLGLVD
jgi:hypothetical protein